ncbi:hypothetical protein EW146_g2036 [Bondarzewia mesenterica]|uniref:GOST seven transmembrane domain-containing protein n=1 Tax=Bondarzewia mesenterica TaxID=1095465 RepID=A0A4S4M481_9AGAM|nr:hypothetical protein EW146_g2036 [Bondarzewia mesenterica]
MLRSFGLLTSLLSAAFTVAAYDVPLLDTDYSRQICSGMWSNSKTYINVSFDSTSQGQLAMVIYEWKDSPYLGKVTSETDDSLPVSYHAVQLAAHPFGPNGHRIAENSQMGRFILDLPEGKSINDTSFWSARVAFPSSGGSSTTPSDPASTSDVSAKGFWDNPSGNPTPPPSEYDSPWRPRGVVPYTKRQSNGPLNPSPSGIYYYRDPIQYFVRKTGYYCVAVVPVTVLQSSMPQVAARQNTSSGIHPEYQGLVHFQNKFKGQLPATDYPKVTFYLVMFIVATSHSGAHAYYLSGLVGFLIIEMVANLAYYRYLNAHGKGAASTVFLFVVAILDAGRNSLSFFMLLVVSLGLSVVKDSLGRTMRKCQFLAVAHFIFGVLYAVGIVELEFESASAIVLLMFVVPLAFTLSGFLMWILYSLNATISQLKARKQHYKLRMFQRLHYILLFVVLVIAIFFVVSSLSFSGRLAEDYAAKTWKVRWWLLDGWLALLFLFAFTSIAYLWRPSANNRR